MNQQWLAVLALLPQYEVQFVVLLYVENVLMISLLICQEDGSEMFCPSLLLRLLSYISPSQALFS